MDDSDRVEFTNVEVLAHNEHVMLCRGAGKVVTIPRPSVLPGSTIQQKGDVGTLVLTRQVAKGLDLL
jgi:hypothetical protein